MFVAQKFPQVIPPWPLTTVLGHPHRRTLRTCWSCVLGAQQMKLPIVALSVAVAGYCFGLGLVYRR